MSDNEAIFTMLSDIRSTQLDQAEKLGGIAADIKALAGPEGRVTKLEKSLERQWWYSTILAPAIAIAHMIARRFGANV